MLRKTKTSISVILSAMALFAGIIWGAPARASDPFLGEIKIVGFNFAPRGWAFCDGQILPINQNQSLYSLLGTTYGGDGRTSFALPDLRGRFAIHDGGSAGPGLTRRPLGQRSGQEAVTLTVQEIPSHTHQMRAHGGQGNREIPTGTVLAYDRREKQYSNQAPDVDMNAGAITSAGGNQAHNNLPPYLVVHYCIALQGTFPSRN
jgi:microcystin-dependent protein